MKTKKLSFAIIAMAIVAFTVAIVACKKDTGNALNSKDNNAKEAFDLRKIDDINAYLKDFRQKMTEGKGEETMNVDEAAWHLACLANLDLCNASIEFNDVRFDTIEMQVAVTDGAIAMSDLRDAYERMIPEIQRFEGTLGLENQNLRFVDVFITESGNARINLMTTSNHLSRDLYDYYWYFPDTFGYLDSICYYQFTAYQYPWNTTAKSELERVMNVFEGRVTPFVLSYLPTRTVSFDYPQWIDPYGSSFNKNSRLCAYGFYNASLSQDEMCYCLDSYLGLGVDYLDNNYYVDNEYPIYWTIESIDSTFSNEHLITYYHRLNVRYGIPATAGPGPLPDD